jgi:hypothetical protein
MFGPIFWGRDIFKHGPNGGLLRLLSALADCTWGAWTITGLTRCRGYRLSMWVSFCEIILHFLHFRPCRVDAHVPVFIELDLRHPC